MPSHIGESAALNWWSSCFLLGLSSSLEALRFCCSLAESKRRRRRGIADALGLAGFFIVALVAIVTNCSTLTLGGYALARLVDNVLVTVLI